MKNQLNPTPMPEELREALQHILWCFWQTTRFDGLCVRRDRGLFCALETVRCHLMGDFPERNDER